MKMTTPKSFLVQLTIYGVISTSLDLLEETLPIVYFARSLVRTSHMRRSLSSGFEADLQDSACMWLELGLYEIYVDLRYHLGVYQDMHHLL